MMRRTPMKRGTKPLKAKKPWRPRYKSQSKRPNREFAAACYGEQCYLRVPGGCEGPVVPCHSNQQIHGKGMGLKADDYYTVPGCRRCHHEIDQGKELSKDGRRAVWDKSFEAWLPRRGAKMNEQGD